MGEKCDTVTRQFHRLFILRCPGRFFERNGFPDIFHFVFRAPDLDCPIDPGPAC